MFLRSSGNINNTGSTASSTQPESTPAIMRRLDDIFNMADTSDQDDGISTTGIVFLVLAIVAVLLATLYYFCCRKKQNKTEPAEKEEEDECEERESQTTASLEPIDLVSCTSECEEVDDDNLDIEESIFPSPSDLGRHHSALDVHQCRSAQCLACHRDDITFLAAAPPLNDTEEANEKSQASAALENDEQKQEGVCCRQRNEESTCVTQYISTISDQYEGDNEEINESHLHFAPLGDGNVRINITTTNAPDSDATV